MSEWISIKARIPAYIRFRRMNHSPTVLIRFRGDKDWTPDCGRPKGVDFGCFTVHTKEWRRHGHNHACEATHWMPMPDAKARGQEGQ